MLFCIGEFFADSNNEDLEDYILKRKSGLFSFI